MTSSRRPRSPSCWAANRQLSTAHVQATHRVSNARRTVSFEHVVTFNMDDTSTSSARVFHILNGNAPTWRRSVKSNEAKIKTMGGIELFLGGIGAGWTHRVQRARLVLTSRTARQDAWYVMIRRVRHDRRHSRFFDNDIKKVPTMALTVGVGTVMDAREVLIMHHWHRQVVRALQGCGGRRETNMWTVSMIQLHPKACIVCDEDATMELRVKTVKYFKGLADVHRQKDARHNRSMN
ncbi:hypothetical protein PINS_up018285 [Pythium insidiosum]|nr:hypothetical protein PINS_up018285 [Pythium insidiosum]